MIEYFIDGSTKDNKVGVGIVKINEFGFIEKHHFKVEHISPTSNIAEGYSLEKTFEMINTHDLHKNEIINIYTDSQKLSQTFLYNENVEFVKSNFFVKQESNNYFQHIRSLYISLVSRHSNYPLYHCVKSQKARPLIKVFFKDETDNQKYLQEAHSLSRQYITEDAIPFRVEFKAIKQQDKWLIIKDNKDIVAENKRPLIALSYALTQMESQIKQVKLCPQLETILKNTNKNKLSNESMKSAFRILEKHRLLVTQ